jgi:hypothetical protein
MCGLCDDGGEGGGWLDMRAMVIHQPINQQTNRPINQSISHPSINQKSNQSSVSPPWREHRGLASRQQPLPVVSYSHIHKPTRVGNERHAISRSSNSFLHITNKQKSHTPSPPPPQKNTPSSSSSSTPQKKGHARTKATPPSPARGARTHPPRHWVPAGRQRGGPPVARRGLVERGGGRGRRWCSPRRCLRRMWRWWENRIRRWGGRRGPSVVVGGVGGMCVCVCLGCVRCWTEWCGSVEKYTVANNQSTQS